jgi:hypothetical protein
LLVGTTQKSPVNNSIDLLGDDEIYFLILDFLQSAI